MTKAAPSRLLKDRLKTAFPAAAARYLQAKEQMLRLAARDRYLQGIFSGIYTNNLWGDPESVSGPGSSREETLAVREELPRLVRRLGVSSLLDAACGDCYWLDHTRLDLDRYIGVDIVPELIARNRQRLARTGIEFVVNDITRDPLPRADLILCRDCLIHFSFHYISRALQNFRRSGATYLLTTTYSGLGGNHDILTGQWRPIDLELPPFGLPKPLRLLCEKNYRSGSLRLRRNLGLWRLAEIGGPAPGGGAR
ncbi:MAG TPA: class I SAM-dependent methyltransferase [Thermoanaerobaculia bacterium]|nr:class I SAM-dependent methyltransferase [Thermoanaerobaculia bacterium]